jgi:hypothetical protein
MQDPAHMKYAFHPLSHSVQQPVGYKVDVMTRCIHTSWIVFFLINSAT